MYDELEKTAETIYNANRTRMALHARLVPWNELSNSGRAHWRGVALDVLNETRSVSSPLNKLRVSLARIAQKLDLDIPACSTEANFTDLSRAAQHEERGWNGLAASIADAIEILQREVQGLHHRNRSLDGENARLEQEYVALREEIELREELGEW